MSTGGREGDHPRTHRRRLHEDEDDDLLLGFTNARPYRSACLSACSPNTVVVCLGLVLLSVVVGIGLTYYPIGGRGGGKPLAQGTPFRLRWVGSW